MGAQGLYGRRLDVLVLTGLAVASLAAGAAPATAQDAGGALIFQVDHVPDDAGHVRVDVCTEATFLKGPGCPFHGDAAAVKGETTVRVEGVPPGVYAAQAYHDRNDNEKVDRKPPFGLPVEGVGFSNNAPIGLRGPRWSGAAFTHDVADQTLTIRLHHY